MGDRDGLHLGTAGYDLLWTEIERLVRTEFEGMGIDWNDARDLAPSAPGQVRILSSNERFADNWQLADDDWQCLISRKMN